MSKPGFTATRSDALRAAIAKGLTAIRKEEESRPRTAEAAIAGAIERFGQRDAAPCPWGVIEMSVRQAGFDLFDLEAASKKMFADRRLIKEGSGYRIGKAKHEK